MPKKKTAGRPRKYDWDAWLAAAAFTLVRGRHYTCSQTTIAQAVRDAASARRISVHVADLGDRVAVRRDDA